MLFQPIDERKFSGLYIDGHISHEIPVVPCKTWRFCDYLADFDVTYASLYCGGKSLSEVCPQAYSARWQHVSGQMLAHIQACRISKVDLNSYTLLSLVPERLLYEFLDMKNKITQHVLQEYPKPSNYDFLYSLERLVSRIRKQALNVNLDAIKADLTTARARSMYKRIKKSKVIIDYDLYKTKTGRLTTKKGSFPILTLDKQFRSVLEPNNDLFLELDFNAAELRTMLALLGKEQPNEDIHEWNIKNVFSGSETREQAKKKVFAWLYNPDRRDPSLDKMYDREAVVKKYFNDGQVNTFLSRVIPADEKHALNYIIQSTTSDLLLKRAIEVDKILSGTKSNIAFTLHDSLIIDLSLEDKGLLKEIINIFCQTELGNYVVNASAGRNFGDMRAIKV